MGLPALLFLAIALYSAQECQSFSARSIDLAQTSPLFHVDQLRKIDHQQPKPFSRFREPAPPIVPAWSRENYLQLHQSVRKRRVVRRLIEIGTILSGQIFRPLLCSLTTGPHRLSNQKTADDWDAFWLRKARHGTLSNAQRVAEGLPGLGPTWTKLGQILATRPDILHVPLADALANLQDNVSPFDNMTAKRIIRRDLDALVNENIQNKVATYLRTRSERKSFLDSLSDQPVASGTIAQVYKADLPGYGPVAVKVQRPGIRRKVENDATLFHSIATWLEGLKWPRGTPMHGQPVVGSTQIVRLVDEFTSRVFEDMDFKREAENMKMFADLYCITRGSSETVKVVVPGIVEELCSNKVIVMQWIEGTKLTDIEDCGEERQAIVEENLAVVKKGIECTLSQLFENGLLHAGTCSVFNLL